MSKTLKKSLSILATIILLTISLFMLTACGDRKDPSKDPSTETENKASITVSNSLKSDAENVLDNIQTYVLDKLTKVDEGNTNGKGTYTVAQAQEEIPEFTQYYVLVGTLSNVDSLTSVGFGDTVYTENQTIPLSVGLNKFITDKVYYVSNNQLYMAAPIVLVESAGQTKIKLNNTEVDFNVNPSVETFNFSSVAFCFNTTNSVEYSEDENLYTCTYKEGAGKSMIGFYYDGMAQNDIAINRLYKNGKLNSYSITSNTDADKNSNYPITYYLIPYISSGDVNEIDAERHNNARFELKSYVQGKGVATANVLNVIDYTTTQE